MIPKDTRIRFIQSAADTVHILPPVDWLRESTRITGGDQFADAVMSRTRMLCGARLFVDRARTSPAAAHPAGSPMTTPTPVRPEQETRAVTIDMPKIEMAGNAPTASLNEGHQLPRPSQGNPVILTPQERAANILCCRMPWPLAQQCAAALDQAGFADLTYARAVDILRPLMPEGHLASPPTRAEGAVRDLAGCGLVPRSRVR